MHDALIAAADSRAAYHRPRPARLEQRIDPLIRARGSSYPATRVVVAETAARVLIDLFPNEPDSTFTRMVDKVGDTALLAGIHYPSDVEAGRELGDSVAQLCLLHAETDGHTNTGDSNPRPEGDEFWEPTPPGFERNTGGPVGTWKPWLMSSPDQARVESAIPPPFEYGSPEFMAELDEVMDVQAGLDQHPDQAEIARYWDDGPGTFTPSGHWFQIAQELAASNGFGTNKTALMNAYLGATMYDAVIAFFEAKYLWWSIRPVTVVRRLCDDGVTLCTKAELEANPERATYPDWSPLIFTPPFPGYPGGHSTFSGSAGRLLSHFFPGSAALLDDFAGEAAVSRLYGGIHFHSDNEQGLVLGRQIGDYAIARLATGG